MFFILKQLFLLLFCIFWEICCILVFFAIALVLLAVEVCLIDQEPSIANIQDVSKSIYWIFSVVHTQTAGFAVILPFLGNLLHFSVFGHCFSNIRGENVFDRSGTIYCKYTRCNKKYVLNIQCSSYSNSCFCCYFAFFGKFVVF